MAALTGIQLIFNEIVQALEPHIGDHASYVHRLRDAHRMSKEGNLPGLLDMLDSLLNSSMNSSPPEAPVQLSDPEATDDEDDLDDLSSYSHPVRRRVSSTAIRYSTPQREILRHHFYVVKDYWPSLYLRKILAKMFNVTPRSIYFWFANERRLKQITQITRVEAPTVLTRDEERRLLLQYRVQAGRPTMVIP